MRVDQTKVVAFPFRSLLPQRDDPALNFQLIWVETQRIWVRAMENEPKFRLEQAQAVIHVFQDEQSQWMLWFILKIITLFQHHA